MNRHWLQPERIPQPPGRCSRCGAVLLEPREASVMRIDGRFRLICRSRTECRKRQEEKGQEAAA